MLEEKFKNIYGYLYSCKTGLCALKCGVESIFPLCCKEFTIFYALLNSCGRLTPQTVSDIIVIFLNSLQVRALLTCFNPLSSLTLQTARDLNAR
jgi:hypothetical protein